MSGASLANVVQYATVSHQLVSLLSYTMESKSKDALLQFGARKILVELANVSGEALASQFIESYGELHPVRKTSSDVEEAAAVFRTAWDCPAERGAMELFIEKLFTLPVDGPFGRPVLQLDYAGGRWEPRPRCLIEHLALELIHSRKMLHRCERPECRRYFVKAFSRDRYCRHECAEKMRSESQLQWQRDNREKINARRRKPARSGKSKRQR